MRFGNWIASAALMLIACAAQAQTYPAKPVRIIVPFPPGGATDIVTRIVAQKLNEIWGQSIVVDNRGGAGGNVGAEVAAKAPPDGYTLFMPSGSVVTANQHIYKKLPFNAEKDFVAITNVASGPQIVAVHPSFPAKSIKEMIAIAKANPSLINFGSAGVGSQTHLAAENFLHTARIDAVHIPYKGEGPALVDLVAGQIIFMTPNLSASIGFVQQNRIRALGVTSRKRSPQVPNVPAIAETLPGFENLGWFGLVAPTGTPQAILDKIHADVTKVLAAADVKKRFEDLGMAPAGNTPAAFARAMREESERWARVVRERKLQIN
ncbi:MAG TPA: tripartite tricarboxylate transporter substrate binding protein [Burkholderiales bacterium]|nr:tripartite tricarboxylate transporter substrate binding protein [Burkholderiales bacterium]